MRILIADDDRICALLLASTLKAYGDCTVVHDGVAAVREVSAGLSRSQPFALICLDIAMPELDGHTALRSIRAIEAGFRREGPNGARILMTTASGRPEDIKAAFNAQCEGYLVKPIDPEKLKRQLAELGFAPG